MGCESEEGEWNETDQGSDMVWGESGRGGENKMQRVGRRGGGDMCERRVNGEMGEEGGVSWGGGREGGFGEERE